MVHIAGRDNQNSALETEKIMSTKSTELKILYAYMYM